MSLPYGLLGLLKYRESTGYDLSKMFEDSLNNFWHAQSSQIYRELKRMEDSGLVSSRTVVQDGRPNKRLYAITDAGRRELDAWLTDARPQFENTHHEILMRVFFGAEAPSATLQLLEACRDECKRALEANCTQIKQVIRDYSNQVEDGQQKSPYWEMTLDYGIAMTKTMLEWTKKCIAKIKKEKMEK